MKRAAKKEAPPTPAQQAEQALRDAIRCLMWAVTGRDEARAQFAERLAADGVRAAVGWYGDRLAQRESFGDFAERALGVMRSTIEKQPPETPMGERMRQVSRALESWGANLTRSLLIWVAGGCDKATGQSARVDEVAEHAAQATLLHEILPAVVDLLNVAAQHADATDHARQPPEPGPGVERP